MFPSIDVLAVDRAEGGLSQVHRPEVDLGNTNAQRSQTGY